MISMYTKQEIIIKCYRQGKSQRQTPAHPATAVAGKFRELALIQYLQAMLTCPSLQSLRCSSEHGLNCAAVVEDGCSPRIQDELHGSKLGRHGHCDSCARIHFAAFWRLCP